MTTEWKNSMSSNPYNYEIAKMHREKKELEEDKHIARKAQEGVILTKVDDALRISKHSDLDNKLSDEEDRINKILIRHLRATTTKTDMSETEKDRVLNNALNDLEGKTLLEKMRLLDGAKALQSIEQQQPQSQSGTQTTALYPGTPVRIVTQERSRPLLSDAGAQATSLIPGMPIRIITQERERPLMFDVGTKRRPAGRTARKLQRIDANPYIEWVTNHLPPTRKGKEDVREPLSASEPSSPIAGQSPPNFEKIRRSPPIYIPAPAGRRPAPVYTPAPAGRRPAPVYRQPPTDWLVPQTMDRGINRVLQEYDDEGGWDFWDMWGV